MADTRTGTLTLYSYEGNEIYGEFAEASWASDPHGQNPGHVISGVATEGIFDTMQRINMAGIEHVRFRFQSEEGVWAGNARLLASEHADAPARAIINIEPLDEPVEAGST
jgi:hypothetical protein